MSNQNQYPDGHLPTGDQLEADEGVTERFKDLDKALHGDVETELGGDVNWNGDDEAKEVFDKFLQALAKDSSLSEPRPDADDVWGQQAQAQSQSQQAHTQKSSKTQTSKTQTGS